MSGDAGGSFEPSEMGFEMLTGPDDTPDYIPGIGPKEPKVPPYTSALGPDGWTPTAFGAPVPGAGWPGLDGATTGPEEPVPFVPGSPADAIAGNLASGLVPHNPPDEPPDYVPGRVPRPPLLPEVDALHWLTAAGDDEEEGQPPPPPEPEPQRREPHRPPFRPGGPDDGPDYRPAIR